MHYNPYRGYGRSYIAGWKPKCSHCKTVIVGRPAKCPSCKRPVTLPMKQDVK